MSATYDFLKRAKLIEIISDKSVTNDSIHNLLHALDSTTLRKIILYGIEVHHIAYGAGTSTTAIYSPIFEKSNDLALICSTDVNEANDAVHTLQSPFDVSDLSYKIFQYLDFKSLIQCRKVNRQFMNDAFKPSAIYHVNMNVTHKLLSEIKDRSRREFHMSCFSQCKSIEIPVLTQDLFNFLFFERKGDEKLSHDKDAKAVESNEKDEKDCNSMTTSISDSTGTAAATKLMSNQSFNEMLSSKYITSKNHKYVTISVDHCLEKFMQSIPKKNEKQDDLFALFFKELSQLHTKNKDKNIDALAQFHSASTSCHPQLKVVNGQCKDLIDEMQYLRSFKSTFKKFTLLASHGFKEYTANLNNIYQFAQKMETIAIPRITVTSIHHPFDISGSRALKWQNISLDLNKSRVVQDCMDTVYKMYQLGMIGCTLWFRIDHKYYGKLDEGLEDAIKNAKWIQLLINALLHAFQQDKDKDRDKGEDKTKDNILMLTGDNENDNQIEINFRDKSNMNSSDIFYVTDELFPVFWLWFNYRIRLVLIQENYCIAKDETKKNATKDRSTQIVFKIILMRENRN